MCPLGFSFLENLMYYISSDSGEYLQVLIDWDTELVTLIWGAKSPAPLTREELILTLQNIPVGEHPIITTNHWS